MEDLITQGWTTLTLWSATTPDGTYTNTAATVSPATLALMDSTDVFTATFTSGASTPAMYFKIRAFDGSAYSALSDAAPFHGGGGTTLASLRHRIIRELRDGDVGTATGGSTTTATVTAAKFLRRRDSYYNGYIFNNTTDGEWTTVSTWTQTGTFALTPALAAAVSNGDSIEVTRRWTPDDYRDAINFALLASYPVLSRSIVNTGLRTDTNIYQFDVPQDIRTVASLEIESSANASSVVPETRGHPWTDVPYRVLRDGLRQKIELETPYIADRRLRLIGYGPLAQVYNETDYVEVLDPELDYIVWLACFHLYSSLPNDSAASDIDRYQALAKHYWDLGEKFKDGWSRGRPPKRLWSAETRAFGTGPVGMGSWARSV